MHFHLEYLTIAAIIIQSFKWNNLSDAKYERECGICYRHFHACYYLVEVSSTYLNIFYVCNLYRCISQTYGNILVIYFKKTNKWITEKQKRNKECGGSEGGML